MWFVFKSQFAVLSIIYSVPLNSSTASHLYQHTSTPIFHPSQVHFLILVPYYRIKPLYPPQLFFRRPLFQIFIFKIRSKVFLHHRFKIFSCSSFFNRFNTFSFPFTSITRICPSQNLSLFYQTNCYSSLNKHCLYNRSTIDSPYSILPDPI